MTVIGTDKNIPRIPQSCPQTANAIKITKGLKFNELPKNLGSIKLPTINWVIIIPPVIKAKGQKLA